MTTMKPTYYEGVCSECGDWVWVTYSGKAKNHYDLRQPRPAPVCDGTMRRVVSRGDGETCVCWLGKPRDGCGPEDRVGRSCESRDKG